MHRWLLNVSNKAQSWFEQNMHAQKMQSPTGECSFCALRNLPKFCELIPSCVVVTDDDIYTVTWQPNISGLKLTLENGLPPRDMTKFFTKTNPEKLASIFEKMAREAGVEKQR